MAGTSDAPADKLAAPTESAVAVNKPPEPSANSAAPSENGAGKTAETEAKASAPADDSTEKAVASAAEAESSTVDPKLTSELVDATAWCRKYLLEIGKDKAAQKATLVHALRIKTTLGAPCCLLSRLPVLHSAALLLLPIPCPLPLRAWPSSLSPDSRVCFQHTALRRNWHVRSRPLGRAG